MSKIINNEEVLQQINSEKITRKDMLKIFETLHSKGLINQSEFNNAQLIINSKYKI